jgi:hypothetical protein
MSRHHFWIPLAAAAVALLFALICVLVRVSRGHPWLVRRKLAVGALLLSLTWTAAGCKDGSVTCYAPAPPDVIEFDAMFLDDGGLVVNLANGTRLTGIVSNRTASSFAFLLADTAEVEIGRGAITPADGAFDENNEDFVLEIGDAVDPGNYLLEIYAADSDGIVPGEYRYRTPLTVVDAAP